MLSAILALALAVASPQDTSHVVLVATTDVHGHATEWDFLTGRPFPGGLARAATVVDSLRARYPGQVVLVDAGDLIQGEPFAAYFAQVAPRDPHPVIDAMNVMGYDAATPGNHEFNFGVDVLERAYRGARFPVVSANIRGLPTDSLVFSPFTVVRRGDVRIAIGGWTTPGVMVWDRENVRGRMRVAPVAGTSAAVVEAMRRDADLAVVAIHSGMDGGSSYDTTGVGPENVAATFAALPTRPDVVVVGHSHREMRDSVLNGVHFVQPKNYAQSVTVTHIDLVKEGGRWRPVRIRGELVSLATVPPAPKVTRALERDRAAVERWVGEPLARTSAVMSSALARAEPTPIINLIHAVQRARTGAELSAASAFNLGATFGPGPIRLADVAALYPYENTLRAVRISGAQLRAYLEQSARYFRVNSIGRVALNDSIPGYNFDMVSGAEYEIDLARPVGQRIQGLRVRGRPVQPADSFTLALNNYRQGGGGGFEMLKGAPVVYDRNENIRDLIVEELRRRRSISPAELGERNWRIVPEEAALQLRALFGDTAAKRAASREPVLLRILATTDFHGALEPRVYSWSNGRPVGGVAALKGLMDSVAAECECPTLRLDGGDEMQGTLLSSESRGRLTVDVFNRLGIDAAAIGNHDLDWSVDTLRARMREARYAWLAANVFDSATGRRPEWARPWVELQAGNLRVAVVGYLTADAKTAVRPRWIAGLRVDSTAAALDDVLAEVRGRRPDFTVLLAHAGAICDSTGCSGEIMELARALPRGSVDVIVAGHTHRLVDTEVNGIPIVEARNNGAALGVVDLVALPEGGRRVRTRLSTVWADSVTPDTALAALVTARARRLDSMTSQVVARVKLPLPRRGPQYPLGNLLAEARRNVLRADVGLVGNGGIRADVAAGELTYGQLHTVQPFQNELVLVTLTGRELRVVLEHALADTTPHAHVAGVVVRYDPRGAAGKRVRAVTLADGRRVRDGARYTVATDDFLAEGGSGFSMLPGRPTTRSGIMDVDGLRTYLLRLPQPVVAPEDARFISVSR